MNTIAPKTKSKALFAPIKHQLIIVADCAKAEHVIQFYDSQKAAYVLKKALHVKNDKKGFAFLLDKINDFQKKMKITRNEIFFTMEDPASYSENFISFLRDENIATVYVNALQAKKYRSNNRASSDELDLDGIIRATILGYSYLTCDQNSIYTQIKAIARGRIQLIKLRTSHKNQLRNIVDQVFPGFLSPTNSGINSYSKAALQLMAHKDFGPRMFVKETKKNRKILEACGFNNIDKRLKNLMQLSASALDVSKLSTSQYEINKNRIQSQMALFSAREASIENDERLLAQLLAKTPYLLLTSIVGCGLISASTIAGELGDPRYLRSPDQIASYAGVVPTQKQSGGDEKPAQVGRWPRARNPHLKNALLTIVRKSQNYKHSAHRHTGQGHPLQEHFDKINHRHGRPFASTAKKLVRMICAMLRDEVIYYPPAEDLTHEQIAIWLDTGTQALIKKWDGLGVPIKDDNYLGKWLKRKEIICDCLILE